MKMNTLAHPLPLKPNALRPRAHSLSLNFEEARYLAPEHNQPPAQAGKHATNPGSARQRYASLSCGSTESGYSSDALAQSTGVSRMSPWTSGGCNVVAPPTASTDTPTAPTVARVDTPTSPGYKFKNDIHLRFKAAVEMQTEAGFPGKEGTCVAEGVIKDVKVVEDHVKGKGEPKEFKRKRAGFVLHREGRYYLPIQLSEELLPESVKRAESRSSRAQNVNCDPACHPISISVRLAE